VIALGGEFSRSVASSRRMPSDRDEVIVELYEKGMPVAQIAARTAVCIKTVRNVARRAGVPPRHRPRPERDASIVRAYQAGEPVGRIAARHAVSRPRVRYIAGRAGLPPRHGWQRLYPINEMAFDQPSRVGWWLIGLLAADGSINAAENRISLCQSTKDIDVLRAFYEYVGCPDRPVTMLNLSEAARARQLPRGPAAEARVFSKRLVDAVGQHGIVPRKTASMELSPEASLQPAVWLGILDGDGSAGIYRDGRAPKLSFAGSEPLMAQCEDFWRKHLGIEGPRPAARRHANGIWVFDLWCAKAERAAHLLLDSTPISMQRKRAVLTQIAGRTAERHLCEAEQRAMLFSERRLI
jgi:hypothetical protein